LSIVERIIFNLIRCYKDALIALRKVDNNKFLSVVYKEVDEKDGFILTSYFTSKIKLDEEEILWKK
jgi:hypothetical protein